MHVKVKSHTSQGDPHDRAYPIFSSTKQLSTPLPPPSPSQGYPSSNAMQEKQIIKCQKKQKKKEEREKDTPSRNPTHNTLLS